MFGQHEVHVVTSSQRIPSRADEGDRINRPRIGSAGPGAVKPSVGDTGGSHCPSGCAGLQSARGHGAAPRRIPEAVRQWPRVHLDGGKQSRDYRIMASSRPSKKSPTEITPPGRRLPVSHIPAIQAWLQATPRLGPELTGLELARPGPPLFRLLTWRMRRERLSPGYPTNWEGGRGWGEGGSHRWPSRRELAPYHVISRS